MLSAATPDGGFINILDHSVEAFLRYILGTQPA